MIVGQDAWQTLTAELDAWAAANLKATFWWRDDDAIEPTLALDRMLELSAQFAVPLGLAVIPANSKAVLRDCLALQSTVNVLQHGYIHKNHAPQGARAAEFGPERSLALRLAEQAAGWARLSDFSRRVPIFVPPWNRYDQQLASGFTAQGISAVSAFGPAGQLPLPIVECNCHVDIISWRTTRGFAGVEKSVKKIVDHLQARRTGTQPLAEATGILSHHLVHDEGCWEFLTTLFEQTGRHSSARWLRPMAAVMRTGTT